MPLVVSSPSRPGPAPSEPAGSAPWARPRLAVRVTRDALRQIRGGHPWVFDRSVTSVRGAGRAGDLAVVFDDRRRFAAIGLYDPDSPVAVRLLHRGSPETIDQSWLDARFAAALQRREPVRTGPETTTGFRLVHGENDGLGGLVVDHYDGTSVIKVYTAAWLPWLDAVVASLHALAGPGSPGSAPAFRHDRAVLRLARRVGSAPGAGDHPPARRGRAPGGAGDGPVLDGPVLDGSVLDGSVLAGPVRFREAGLEMEADVVRGHKTGHFFDQRENRLLIRHHSHGRRVLDVFSCTGGFALNAAVGGASSVVATDRSRAALATLRANFAHNGLAAGPGPAGPATIEGDAFEVMARLAGEGRRFDLVVVDPPSFAQRARQVRGALDGYRRLARLAAGLVAPDGLLFQASCSSRVDEDAFVAAMEAGLADAGYRSRLVAATGHAADHPVDFAFGAYLKARLVRPVPVRR
ncbi:MAG: class I SAM-dependent rRNA methyltransferase [Acidimicrobiales bacterium]